MTKIIAIHTNDGIKFSANFDSYDSSTFAKEMNSPNVYMIGVGGNHENKNNIVILAPFTEGLPTHEIQTYSTEPVMVTLTTKEVSDALTQANNQSNSFVVVGDAIVNRQQYKRLRELPQEVSE